MLEKIFCVVFVEMQFRLKYTCFLYIYDFQTPITSSNIFLLFRGLPPLKSVSVLHVSVEFYMEFDKFFDLKQNLNHIFLLLLHVGGVANYLY